MIENIHSHEGEDDHTGRNITTFKPPKNIKQIGESTSQKKIYVEDYVFTYIKELVKKEYSDCRIAVLLGHYIKTADERIIMIHGAVEAEGIQYDSENVFNNDTWTNVYENIKKYFTDVEVVGWCIGGPGFILENEEKLKKIHLDNFAGVDKAFMKYDSLENEESFYIYEHGGLNLQTGYYIYYEKNDEMQNYLVEHKPSEIKSVKEKEEEAVREYKEEVKEQRVQENNKNIIHLMYAAGSLMVVLVIVVFATLINNNNKIEDLEHSVGELSNILYAGTNEETKKDPTVDVAAKDPSASESNTMDVETISGNLNSIKEETVIGDKAAEIENETTNDQSDDAKVEGQDNTNGDEQSTDKSEASDEQAKSDQEVNTDPASDNTQTEDKEETEGKSEQTEGKSEQTEGNPTDSNKSTDGAHTDSDSLPASSDPSNIKYYEVQKGDTLVGISFKLYNSGDYVTQIMELNHIEDMDMIYFGQKLIVP